MNVDWLLDSSAWQFLRTCSSLISPRLALALSLLSLLMLLGSLFITPWLLIRLPADYFLIDKPHLWTRLKQATLPRRCLLLLKNALGLVCLIAGLLMLVLPGQGLLTLLAGIFLLDFHGKKALERRLVSRPRVLKSINWLRNRYGHPSLLVEDPPPPSPTVG